MVDWQRQERRAGAGAGAGRRRQQQGWRYGTLWIEVSLAMKGLWDGRDEKNEFEALVEMDEEPRSRAKLLLSFGVKGIRK